MSYSKIEGIPVEENETTVILDSGEIVAFSISTSPNGGRIVYSGSARWVTDSGDQVYGVAGPVTSSISLSDPRVSSFNQISKDCIMALLGEPVSFVQWSEQFLMDVSIRNAIHASSISSGPLDPSELI